MHDMRWSVKERHGLASVEPLHAGVFTVVQRFRSDVGLYVHLHSLITDGAFEEAGADVRFLPARAPTPERMTAVLAQVHKAIAEVAEDDDLDMDPACRRARSEDGLSRTHSAVAAPAVYSHGLFLPSQGRSSQWSPLDCPRVPSPTVARLV